MKLDDYLKKIQECPDEFVKIDGEKRHRLYNDFNIYDNFSMLLKGNFDGIISDLKGLDFKVISEYGKKYASEDYRGCMLTNNDCASRLQLRSYPSYDDLWPDFEFLRKQGFNLFAMVHFPNQENRDKFNITFPEMAKTIKIVGDYSMENKIKLAFPEIKDGLGNNDIVFYDPSKWIISRFK